jgi:hypothetical protein
MRRGHWITLCSQNGLSFLRQVGGQWLRRSTNAKLLMAEFGCRPVSWQWCKWVCQYWNRLASQQQNSLLQHAFRAQLEQAARGVAGWQVGVSVLESPGLAARGSGFELLEECVVDLVCCWL